MDPGAGVFFRSKIYKEANIFFFDRINVEIDQHMNNNTNTLFKIKLNK